MRLPITRGRDFDTKVLERNTPFGVQFVYIKCLDSFIAGCAYVDEQPDHGAQ